MKIGIVCCSDGIRQGYEDEIEELHRTLADMGIESVFSPFLCARDGVASGTAEERAKAGTAYMPDLHGKILLLESRSGTWDGCKRNRDRCRIVIFCFAFYGNTFALLRI